MLQTVMVILTLLLLVTDHGFSAPQKGSGIHLYEPELAETNEGLFVAFEKNCGSDFFAFVLRENKTAKGLDLEVGIALKHSSLLCTGGPEMLAMKLPAIKQKKYRTIRPMEVSRPTPMVIARVYQIGLEQGKVLGLAENRCGALVGTFIRPIQNEKADAIKIELGFVHEVPKKGSVNLCQTSPMIRTMVSLDKAWILKARPWVEKNQQISGAYSIKTKDIIGLASSGYKYLRRCNEAPIGIAESLGNPIRHRIVVARFYNHRCPENISPATVDILSLRGLPILPLTRGRGYDLSVAGFQSSKAASDGLVNEDWLIQPIVSKKNLEHGQSFRFWSPCGTEEKDTWRLWARDGKGQLSLAILGPIVSSNPSSCLGGSGSTGAFRTIDVEKGGQDIQSLRLRHI